eukprot:TRINITY_DN80122_c0_g1_i1.p1 TRINITY_DN80122_c0_g1~~TRINITY_DN80122_c0_g1_i1.p1  ORF type:complete len:608 (-),score=121.35 TRINITY_DN80122_c0_g1_i1:98-1921(-)
MDASRTENQYDMAPFAQAAFGGGAEAPIHDQRGAEDASPRADMEAPESHAMGTSPQGGEAAAEQAAFQSRLSGLDNLGFQGGKSGSGGGLPFPGGLDAAEFGGRTTAEDWEADGMRRPPPSHGSHEMGHMPPAMTASMAPGGLSGTFASPFLPTPQVAPGGSGGAGSAPWRSSPLKGQDARAPSFGAYAGEPEAPSQMQQAVQRPPPPRPPLQGNPYAMQAAPPLMESQGAPRQPAPPAFGQPTPFAGQYGLPAQTAPSFGQPAFAAGRAGPPPAFQMQQMQGFGASLGTQQLQGQFAQQPAPPHMQPVGQWGQPAPMQQAGTFGAPGGAPPGQFGMQQPPVANGPNCWCQQPSVQFTVKKEGPNTGRMFYSCAKEREARCGYFQWSDEPDRPEGKPCQCGQPSKAMTVRKEGPNTGRPFWCCRTRMCDFFEWGDEPPRENAMQGGVAAVARPLPTGPPCPCGQPTAQKTVRKEGPNTGRTFYCCARKSGTDCGHFAWADGAGPSGPAAPQPGAAPLTFRGPQAGFGPWGPAADGGDFELMATGKGRGRGGGGRGRGGGSKKGRGRGGRGRALLPSVGAGEEFEEEYDYDAGVGFPAPEPGMGYNPY